MAAPRQNDLPVRLTNEEMRMVMDLCVAMDLTPNAVVVQGIRLLQKEQETKDENDRRTAVEMRARLDKSAQEVIRFAAEELNATGDR